MSEFKATTGSGASSEDSCYTFPEVEALPVQKGLPDPFLREDGTRVTSKEDWPAQREYLKAMLFHYHYGSVPPKPDTVEIKDERIESVLDGKAECRWLTIVISRNGRTLELPINIVTPSKGGPFPLIIKNDRQLYFPSASELTPDASKVQRDTAVEDHKALEHAIERGYAMAKFRRDALAQDRIGTRGQGIFPLYPEYDWGAIAAWAWGFSLVIDAVLPAGNIDAKQIVATGHSRGGKTALCAALVDERIAVSAPNASGTGGTASFRYFEPGRRKPQTLGSHIGHNDHWWGPRFLKFAGFEDRAPFDAHTPKLLLAPRALINPNGLADYHANPYGVQVTHQAACPVFEWLGCPKHIGVSWRPGGHAQGVEDWAALFDFCDAYFFGKECTRDFNARAYPDVLPEVHWKVPGN